jgi:hypothetical protein
MDSAYKMGCKGQEANRGAKCKQQDGNSSDWAIDVPHVMFVGQRPDGANKH